jgi:hypothetical protein
VSPRRPGAPTLLRRPSRLAKSARGQRGRGRGGVESGRRRLNRGVAVANRVWRRRDQRWRRLNQGVAVANRVWRRLNLGGREGNRGCRWKKGGEKESSSSIGGREGNRGIYGLAGGLSLLPLLLFPFSFFSLLLPPPCCCFAGSHVDNVSSCSP